MFHVQTSNKLEVKKNKTMKQTPRPKLSVFAQLVNNVIDKSEIYRIAKKHDTDKYCQQYDTWSQFIWLLFAHLGNCRSIRDISHALESITGNINHLNMQSAPSKSTVAYQNKNRSYKVFQDIYYNLYETLGQQLGKRKFAPRLERRIKLLDSSTVTLALKAFSWAKYTSEKGAIKIHTLLDFEQDMPSYVHISDGKVGDNTAAYDIPVSKDMVIVADRGYQDFALLKHWDSKKAHFVVRHKQDILFETIREDDLDDVEDQDILKDEVIHMTGPESKKYTEILRRVVVYNEEHQYAVELLTNDFMSEARVISALYKNRWYIESFFKNVKQLLKIKTFFGTSENAVLSQIWVALCAILLLTYLKQKAQYKWHLSNLVVFLRMNIFVKIDIWCWLDKPFTPKIHYDDTPRQGLLF